MPNLLRSVEQLNLSVSYKTDTQKNSSDDYMSSLLAEVIWHAQPQPGEVHAARKYAILSILQNIHLGSLCVS